MVAGDYEESSPGDDCSLGDVPESGTVPWSASLVPSWDCGRETAHCDDGASGLALDCGTFDFDGGDCG